MHSATAIAYHEVVPTVYRALGQVHGHIDRLGVPRALHHLVQLRSSQMNACAYCVDMHTREARADGETSERLDRLVVWRHVEGFRPDERAALAWTEALTALSPNTDYLTLRAQLREHFSDVQISALTGPPPFRWTVGSVKVSDSGVDSSFRIQSVKDTARQSVSG